MRSKLTNLILEIEKDCAPTQENTDKLLNLIKLMYEKNESIYIPSYKTTGGQYAFPALETNFGNCLVMITDMKYFKTNLTSDVMFTSIRTLFDVYFDNKDDCAGIVINPVTETEIFLSKQGIEMLSLKRKGLFVI